MKINNVINIGKYLLFFILALLWWTCSSDGESVLKSDAEFFPVATGSFFVYDVEETQYSPIEGQEDLTYQLKLALTDSFQNLGSGVTYVMQRSTRVDTTESFEYLDTWSVRAETSQVVVNEGNVSYVRLAFPLVEGKQWNGNALNNLEGDETCGDNGSFLCDLYQIESVGIPFEFKGTTLTETIEVLQNNNKDLIVMQDVRKEIYARNIGLVYKESTVLEYCTVGSCIGQQQIESGFIFKQRLVDYGKE